MRYLKAIVLIAIFVLVLIFFVQNDAVLSTNMQLKFELLEYKWLSKPLPFYIMLLAVFVLGIVISLLYFLVDRLRLSSEIKRYKNKVRQLEKELNSLRNIPLQGSSYNQAGSGTRSSGKEQSGSFKAPVLTGENKDKASKKEVEPDKSKTEDD
jgi:uncharacterized integral membrane protein